MKVFYTFFVRSQTVALNRLILPRWFAGRLSELIKPRPGDDFYAVIGGLGRENRLRLWLTNSCELIPHKYRFRAVSDNCKLQTLLQQKSLQ